MGGMTAPVVELSSLLVSKPGYRQGRPCLRGTGITVHTIAGWSIVGYSSEQICQDWPDLDPSLIHAALAFYFANKDLVERELEEDRIEGERLMKLHPARTPPGAPR